MKDTRMKFYSEVAKWTPNRGSR